ncbi:hypothetical protein AB0P19_07010 [Microbacterium oleivorans]|uniref:hypothetical protein n=1 Tax=Microbacterium oleivorans TaxID=273677 RepID=UPI0034097B2D
MSHVIELKDHSVAVLIQMWRLHEKVKATMRHLDLPFEEALILTVTIDQVPPVDVKHPNCRSAIGGFSS